jgi:hypothetical protein
VERIVMLVKEKRKFNYIVLGLLALVIVSGILYTLNVI